MEFLVQFELDVPDGVSESEVEDREEGRSWCGRDVGGTRAPGPAVAGFR